MYLGIETSRRGKWLSLLLLTLGFIQVDLSKSRDTVGLLLTGQVLSSRELRMILVRLFMRPRVVGVTASHQEGSLRIPAL